MMTGLINFAFYCKRLASRDLLAHGHLTRGSLPGCGTGGWGWRGRPGPARPRCTQAPRATRPRRPPSTPPAPACASEGGGVWGGGGQVRYSGAGCAQSQPALLCRGPGPGKPPGSYTPPPATPPAQPCPTPTGVLCGWRAGKLGKQRFARQGPPAVEASWTVLTCSTAVWGGYVRG